MAIKRYISKYKKLARFQQPLWYEKRSKIRKFKKQKWERLKKLYYPRKLKFFVQDTSTCFLTRHYNVDRVVRLKKTYKHLLRDKQRLQLYYGNGRYRLYQLKNLVQQGSNSGKTPVKTLFSLLENRLDVVLYRLALVSSIAQARKLITTGRIKIGSTLVKNANYLLKPNDQIIFDNSLKDKIFGLYLRNHAPFFFFRYKSERRFHISQRRKFWKKCFLSKTLSQSLLDLKQSLYQLKEKRKSG